jgi:hypothetical protein
MPEQRGFTHLSGPREEKRLISLRHPLDFLFKRPFKIHEKIIKLWGYFVKRKWRKSAVVLTIYARKGLAAEKILAKVDKKVKKRNNGNMDKGMCIPTSIKETEAEKALPDRELKAACLTFARANFQGRIFTNQETGRPIIVSSDGIGEWRNKTKSREQILSIKILDKLLENGHFDHDAPDEAGRPEIEGFSYYKTLCIINNTPFNAIISIRRVKNYGDKYYHHYLEDVQFTPSSEDKK